MTKELGMTGGVSLDLTVPASGGYSRFNIKRPPSAGASGQTPGIPMALVCRKIKFCNPMVLLCGQRLATPMVGSVIC